MSFKEISEITTVIAAFIGMGLGLFNFFIERSKRKVIVNVLPKAIMKRFRNRSTSETVLMTSLNEFPDIYLDDYFAIEVINKSDFPIVIENIGFEVKGLKERMIIFQPLTFDGGEWPRRLEQRGSVTAYFLLQEILKDQNSVKIKNAFIETSCGAISRGKSGALTGLKQFVANNAQQKC